ncbi:Spermidine N(1)-acetyltransferase [anaerobic digester metagenome]
MDKPSICLRALTKADIDKTLIWHQQDYIRDLYFGHPYPVNKEMEELWYNKILTSNIPTTVFGIEEVETQLLIGITMLKGINLINRNAEFAIYIGDELKRGKGYSKQATLQTLNFAFYNLGLNRIFLKVLERNSIAIELYKKVGFMKEGLIRQSIFKNNKFENELLMSILKEEFTPNEL